MPREISEKLAQKAEFLCYSDKLRSVISLLYLKFWLSIYERNKACEL